MTLIFPEEVVKIFLWSLEKSESLQTISYSISSHSARYIRLTGHNMQP
jgi:hypothetical protein